ncbi:MAG: DNA repair protein RecO [Defluviitaleaceae bacterium]|nr:DNA repair protein RecO [Defluviitaleaceae bacterium]
MTIDVRGIILKEEVVGESDKNLTVLTKNMGKIYIRARGAKKPKSKFMIVSQFAYLDLVLYKGSGFYSLTQASLIESFYNLRLDYERLEVAFFVVKTLNENIIGEMEEVESEAFLFLLVNSLYFLNKNFSPSLVKSVFILKFLQLNGEEPILSENSIITENREVTLPKFVLMAISHVLTSETRLAFSFKINNIELLENLCETML